MTAVFLVLLNSFGQLFLKLGIRYSERKRYYFYFIGYSLFVLSFMVVEFYFRSEPLSSVVYILSVNVLAVAVLSFLFLKEKISKIMLCGLFFIFIGAVVFILGGGNE